MTNIDLLDFESAGRGRSMSRTSPVATEEIVHA